MDLIVVAGCPRSGVGLVASWLAAAVPGGLLVQEPGVARIVRDGPEALAGLDWDGTGPVVAAQVMAEGTATDVLAAVAAEAGGARVVVCTVRNPLSAVTSLLRRPPGGAAIDVEDKRIIERYCNDYRAGLDIEEAYAVPHRWALVDFDRLHDASYRGTVRSVISGLGGLAVASDLHYSRASPPPPLPPRSRNFVHRFIGKDGWARWDRLRGLAAEQAGIVVPEPSEWSAFRPQDEPDGPTADDED